MRGVRKVVDMNAGVTAEWENRGPNQSFTASEVLKYKFCSSKMNWSDLSI